MAPVEGHEAVERHIGYAVTIGQHEGSVADERSKPSHTPAGQRIETRIDKMNLPSLLMAAPPLHLAGAQIDREVARHVGELQKEVLHALGLVAERHDELLEAIGGIELHDVPEDGMLADLHHRLGDGDRLLGKPGAEATGKDHDLHAVPRNGTGSSANRWSRSENASICRRVTAPMSAPFQKPRYPSAVQVTASSNESNGRQPSSARARVASRVRKDASWGCSSLSNRQPGRPSHRVVKAWTRSHTERKLSASGAKFSAFGARTGSMTMACASIR